MEGTQMQLEDWLDDLCVRFIINLPEEDLSSVARICFQVEEAQWFYEDFIRPLDPSLPSMSLRTFCLRIFQHCPLLASFSADVHLQAFEEFLQYKTRVPVRGAILLNEEMDSTVLVKGWKKGANWSFPRGKINKDEDDLDCAIREVWEETGLDLRAAGLVPEGKPKYIEITMREQQMRLYVFRNIPMNTHFQPQTRKEISKIQWYKLSELPAFRKKGVQNSNEEGASNANKFYMVAPFLVPLKKWVVSQKKIEAKKTPASIHLSAEPHFAVDETPLEDDTWSHQLVAPLVAPPPGIDTLQGATSELHRLLKLQPSTQGQPPQTHIPHDDRASALLSMLKSKDPGAEAGRNSGLPHTPLGLTIEQSPQLRNSHYHTDQRPAQIQVSEPPPQFSLHQHHTSMQWNTAQGESYQVHPQVTQQAPLVHPQPLPPQVQRAMFNQSTFQENLQSQRPMEYAPPLGSTLPAPTMPMVSQQHILNNQTLALLNAFKKNPDKLPSVQSAPRQDYVRQGGSAKEYSSYDSSGAGHANPPVSELAGSSSQALPSYQGRAPPGSGTHRSTLLDMFRGDQQVAKDIPKSMQQSLPRAQDAGLTVGGSGMEKQLLDTLRRAPLAPDNQTNAPSKPSYGSTETSAALSDFLALKPRPDQTAAALEQPIHQRANLPSGGINQGPAGHPVRILQRGQLPDGQQRASPSENSPLSNRGPTGLYGSPANASSHPSPSSATRRPEPSQDQKKQLLSLFGKKQLQQSTFAGQGQPSVELPPGEFSRSRLASFASGSAEGSFIQGPPSRGATQTPISPADQTFLLDYLQSVTNTSSR